MIKLKIKKKNVNFEIYDLHLGGVVLQTIK